MQQTREHLARTSSRRRGSCVFSFRLSTRNLRLPTAASNHRRCTHTNTLARAHNLSHDSLTLLFSRSSSHTHTHRQAKTSKTQKNATHLSAFPENTAAAKLVSAAVSSFSHEKESLGPPAGAGSLFTAAMKATKPGSLVTHSPRIPPACF